MGRRMAVWASDIGISAGVLFLVLAVLCLGMWGVALALGTVLAELSVGGLCMLAIGAFLIKVCRMARRKALEGA